MMRSFAHPRVATLYEQAVIASTGFLSMLFFARHLPTVDWATFSFAAALMLLAQGMQLSIVILPMISFSKGRKLTPPEQGNWTWIHRAVMLATLTMSAVAGAFVLWSSSSWMGTSLLYAVLMIPPAFGYEYLRRRLILSQEFVVLARVATAYAVGVAVSVGLQLVLEAPPALAALTYWPGFLLAKYSSDVRDPVRWSAPETAWLVPLKTFAPSAVGSSLAMAGYNVAVQALLASAAGAGAIAAFNATRMLIQPINTLIGAFNSLDLPNAARAYASSAHALVSSQMRSLLRLVVIGGAYLAVLIAFAEPILVLLFKGRYSEQHLLWSWVIVGFLMLITTSAENVFYITSQPQRLLLTRLAAAIVACGCAFLAIPKLGAAGAVLSIAAGWLVALFGAAIVLWILSKAAKA